jgi:MFS family permease
MDSNPSPVTQITSDPFAAVRIPEFKNLMLGRFTFIMALRMMGTLVAWWIYELTDAPLAIGLVGLSEFIPAFSFALYAGYVIDRSEKRKLLLRGIFLFTCAAAVLLFFSTPYIKHHFGNVAIAIGICTVIFGTGIIRAFTGPIFSAVLASTVPRHYLQNATTWNQGSWLAAAVTGHATGAKR